MRLQVGLGMKLYSVLFASFVLSSSQVFGAGQNKEQNDSRSSTPLAVRSSADGSRDGSGEAAVKYPLFTQPSTPTFNGYQRSERQLEGSDYEDSDYEDKSDDEEYKLPATRPLRPTYVKSDTLPQAQSWSFVVRHKGSGKYEEDKIAMEEKELLDDMIAWRYLSKDQQNRSQWHTSPHDLILRLASIFKKDSGFRYQTKDGGFVCFKNDYLCIGHSIKGSFTINLAVDGRIRSRQSSAVGQGGGGLDEKDGEERAEAEQDATPQGRWMGLGSGFLGFGVFLAGGVGILSCLAQKFSRGSGDSAVGGDSPAETNYQVDSEANVAPVLVEEQAQAQVSTQDEVADIAPAIQISEVASNKEVSDSGLDEDLQQVQEALGEVGGDLHSSNHSEAVEKVLVQEGSSVARFVSDETLSTTKKTALGTLLAAGVLKFFHYCYSQYKKNSGLDGAKGKAEMWAEKALYYAQQYKKMTMATAGGLAVVGLYLLQNR